MTTPFDQNAYFNASQLMKSPGAAASASGGNMVYLGPKLGAKKATSQAGPYSPEYLKGKAQGPKVGNYDYTGADKVPYAEAQGMPLQWSESEKKDFINKGILYKMPGFSVDMGMPEIMDRWDDLAQMSAAWSAKGQNWSPWDIMDSYKKKEGFGTIRRGDWLYDAASGEKVKYVGPRSKTTTSKNVNLSSPEDARAITTQMLTELLGRAPSTEELARYRAAINGYENANPEVTTTTSTLDDQGEVTAQSSKTTGGASQAALGGLVEQGAKQGPEYGKYQSATTYFDAMMQMIGGG